MAALMNLCQGHIVMDSQPPDHQACGLACWWWWGKTKRSILLKFSFHNHIFKWLYFGTIVLAIDDNLRWRRKLKMERGNTLSHFFTQTYISHGIIGQQWGLAEKEWTKVGQLSQTERERKTLLSKTARKNITKYGREKFTIVYLPSLSSLMNEFLVARLCSAHLFIKIEKCVNAIHYSIWREQSNFISNMKLTTLRDKISPPRWTSS